MNPTDLAQEAIGPATVGGFSFLELFMQAHLVVQLVMAGLLIASIWSWAIVVEKFFAFRRARAESDRFEHMFWSGQSLDDLYNALSRTKPITMAALFVAAHVAFVALVGLDEFAFRHGVHPVGDAPAIPHRR